jgi:hypothetical protein
MDWLSPISPILDKLYRESRTSVENEHPKLAIDSDEFEYRVIWEMFHKMMEDNFTPLVPEFMEKIPDKQLRILPITLKFAEWNDPSRLFDRFNSIVMLENDRRNNEKMEKYNRQLIIYTMVLTRLTWALVGIGIATILVTAIAIFIQCK